jgi:glycosyltransferase involved in cell wall biosynthesis
MKLITVYSNGTVGVPQELARYLREKRDDFLFLEHPYGTSQNTGTRLVAYRAGEPAGSTEWMPPAQRTAAWLYARCFILTLKTVWRYRRHLDLFVGGSNMDCVAAWLAGRRGMRILFISIDFSPCRFPGWWMNAIYGGFDRLAYACSSAIWHSYPDATRLKPYANPKRCFETLHGNNWHRIARRPWADREPHRMIYLGGVTPTSGLEVAINALGALAPRFPDATLSVIGTSPDPSYMESLQQLARERGVEERVQWHGLIAEAERYETIMTRAGLALCLYQMTPEHHSFYQLPGKIFSYAACGLPTVVLDVSGPITVRDVPAEGIGLVCSNERVAESIAELFDDPERQRRMGDRAREWARPFDWKAKFDRYLTQGV